jgi:hypothetical protein
MEDDDLDLQLLMSGPVNEANMYEFLGGTYCTMTKLLLISSSYFNSSTDKVVVVAGAFGSTSLMVRFLFRSLPIHSICMEIFISQTILYQEYNFP